MLVPWARLALWSATLPAGDISPIGVVAVLICNKLVIAIGHVQAHLACKGLVISKGTTATAISVVQTTALAAASTCAVAGPHPQATYLAIFKATVDTQPHHSRLHAARPCRCQLAIAHTLAAATSQSELDRRFACAGSPAPRSVSA